MRPTIGFVLTLMLLSPSLQAQPPATELIGRLSSGDAATRKAGWEAAPQYGSAAIVAIAPLLDNEQFEVARAARLALENIVGAASVDPEARQECAQSLAMAAMTVKNPEWLLWLLSYAGTEESLEALLALLKNAPQQFERALMAIESLAKVEEGEPQREQEAELHARLLELLPQLPVQHQVAVINTLGVLRAEEALPALLDLPAGPLRAAALQAVARIGSSSALAVLLKEYQRTPDPQVLDALLRAVEMQPVDSREKHYLGLLKMLPGPEAEVDSATANAQAAALLGLGSAKASSRTIRLLISFVDAPRADVAGAASQALVAMPDDSVEAALVKALRRAAPEAQELLLHTLKARNPEAAQPFLGEAPEESDGSVGSDRSDGSEGPDTSDRSDKSGTSDKPDN